MDAQIQETYKSGDKDDWEPGFQMDNISDIEEKIVRQECQSNPRARVDL